MEWIEVSKQMPPSGHQVLAAYKTQLGHWQIIRAEWAAKKTDGISIELDDVEYDEETDTYYLPEGWYEHVNNWDDYTRVVVHEGTPTHWMPLPAPPEGEPT